VKRLTLTTIVIVLVVACFAINAFTDFYVISSPNEVMPENYAPVPKTGQTDCYYDDGVTFGDCTCGDTDCTSGQDGDLQKGIEWPNPRFTDNLNGTVTDNLTGLVWLQNADCLSGETNWASALNYCKALANGMCGLTDSSSAGDWRLPNINELWSLIDHGNNSPALPSSHPFTSVRSSAYFSSTTSTIDFTKAYQIGMSTGLKNYHSKINGVYVWPVRDAK